MNQMRRDYVTHFFEFVKPNGELKLRKDIQVTWDEMLSRIPSYFKKYIRGSAHWKTMNAEQQKLPSLALYK